MGMTHQRGDDTHALPCPASPSESSTEPILSSLIFSPCSHGHAERLRDAGIEAAVRSASDSYGDALTAYDKRYATLAEAA